MAEPDRPSCLMTGDTAANAARALTSPFDRCRAPSQWSLLACQEKLARSKRSPTGPG
jgi:hypothetical protein